MSEQLVQNGRSTDISSIKNTNSSVQKTGRPDTKDDHT